MRLVLVGDGESPHLLKWARALQPHVELFALSSRGFAAGFDAAVPPGRRLALATTPRFEGGNTRLLLELPRAARWLRRVRADWIHAHYVTSHGTLAWLAKALCRVPGTLVASAWGTDILQTPERSAAARWVTRRVLRACAFATSDSRHMAERMRALGARDVMTFPFGLESMPAAPAAKDDRLFLANRALEPIYAPDRVIGLFAALARDWRDASLVLANDGSLRERLQSTVHDAGLGDRVRFVGRLDAAEQAAWYARARWYVSLPTSDSVSVSLLEAMAHGCIPIVSDLPANRELVTNGANGLVVGPGASPSAAELQPLLARAGAIARDNRDWVREHALFGPCVERFVERLRTLHPAR
jgi:glycosyltransferase involved in cell wall biosynthesis